MGAGGLRAPGTTVLDGTEPPDGAGIELVSSESRIHALTPEPAPGVIFKVLGTVYILINYIYGYLVFFPLNNTDLYIFPLVWY